MRKGLQTPSCHVFLTIFILAFSNSAFASQNSYQQSLIQKSQQLNLANNQGWLNMLYYEKNIFGNYESIFDSKEFFLSTNGKINPKAELEATITSFFSTQNLPFKNIFNQQQTAQCAFKARFDWLNQQLKFDKKKLPIQKCQDFENWYEEINPKTATLIFAASYLNNPASMFGHTFLLVNNNEDEKLKILSQAINYSAKTTETNGIIFAYKGLFGRYQGQFGIMPYYKMIKKYNDFENRDLWEYDLNLSPSEVKKLMTSLWEINNNYANYYFFTENCSYLLLKLLQSVKPEIEYQQKITIPSDTVIALAKTPNLIKRTNYRPSKVSKINHLQSQINQELKPLAKKISQGKKLNLSEENILKNLPQNQQKLFYDLSFDYLQYSYQKDKKKSRDEMAKTSLEILQKRSKIKGETILEKIIEPNSNPVLAHNPKRIFIAQGYNNLQKHFSEIAIRPAYHDLLDNENGFLKGAQINVFDLNLRHFSDSNQFKLNYFNLVDIKSYAPRNDLFQPISWQLKVGAKNFYSSEIDYKNIAFAELGFGANYDLSALNSNISFLLNGSANYGKNLPNNNLIAAKPQISIFSDVTKSLKLNFDFSHNFFIEQKGFDYSEFSVKQNFTLRKNLSFRAEYLMRDFRKNRDENEIIAGINYYF